MNLAPKSPAASAVENQNYQVFPNDLNHNGTVFGGLIMAHMDRLCGVVASRHAASVVVTASVDAVHFVQPARRGDILVINATVNRAWHSSMEIGCKVEAEPAFGGTRRHIVTAYFTFVATDADGKPQGVPPVKPETADEKQRYAEADMRRQNRLRDAEALKNFRNGDRVAAAR